LFLIHGLSHWYRWNGGIVLVSHRSIKDLIPEVSNRSWKEFCKVVARAVKTLKVFESLLKAMTFKSF